MSKVCDLTRTSKNKLGRNRSKSIIGSYPESNMQRSTHSMRPSVLPSSWKRITRLQFFGLTAFRVRPINYVLWYWHRIESTVGTPCRIQLAVIYTPLLQSTTKKRDKIRVRSHCDNRTRDPNWRESHTRLVSHYQKFGWSRHPRHGFYW